MQDAANSVSHYRNLLIVIVLFAITLNGCKKDESPSNGLIGKWKRHATGIYLGSGQQEVYFETTYELQIGESSFTYWFESFEQELIDTSKKQRYSRTLYGTYAIRKNNKILCADISKVTSDGVPAHGVGHHYYLFKVLSSDSLSFLSCSIYNRLSGNTTDLLNSSFYSEYLQVMPDSVYHHHEKYEFSADSMDYAHQIIDTEEMPLNWESPPPYDSRVSVFEDYYENVDLSNEKHAYSIFEGNLYLAKVDKAVFLRE